MFRTFERSRLHDNSLAQRFALSSLSFAASAFAFEVLTVVATGILTAALYHAVVYGHFGPIEISAAIASMAGVTYGLIFLTRGDYSIESLVEGARTNGRLFLVWNISFAALALIGFLTKSTSFFSRGWLVLFYIVGLFGMIATRALIERGASILIAKGLLARRRLMLVGTKKGLEDLERAIADGPATAAIVSRVVIPEEADNIGDQLRDAAANARMLGVEDVVISSDLLKTAFLDQAMAVFSLLPVAIHVGAGGLLSHFKSAEVARFGRATTLAVKRQPLGPLEAAAKRILDISASSIALLLLSPLFLTIAALIKLDSRGPVFFCQRRRGFNLHEFGIWKFRTMTTLDDGTVVRQATQDDDRVTRVGRFLRKYSLDELPQLFNVLKGEMSLVGPRPHAVAHDEFFEKRIDSYPRRLSMKPGITGWAQVNGFRGATETDEKMSSRVEHDLYYIDNWSIGFDFYIVLLTIVSRKASQNAY